MYSEQLLQSNITWSSYAVVCWLAIRYSSRVKTNSMSGWVRNVQPSGMLLLDSSSWGLTGSHLYWHTTVISIKTIVLIKTALGCTLYILPVPRAKSLLTVWPVPDPFNSEKEIRGMLSKVTMKYKKLRTQEIKACIYGSPLKPIWQHTGFQARF